MALTADSAPPFYTSVSGLRSPLLQLRFANGWTAFLYFSHDGQTARCGSTGPDGVEVNGEMEATPDQVAEWLNTVRQLKS